MDDGSRLSLDRRSARTAEYRARGALAALAIVGGRAGPLYIYGAHCAPLFRMQGATIRQGPAQL